MSVDYDKIIEECEARAEMYKRTGAVWNATHEGQCKAAITDLLARAEAAEARAEAAEKKAADVRSVVRGWWSRCTGNKYRCTNCGRHTNVDEVMGKPVYNYCPYCGADMRGE